MKRPEQILDVLKKYRFPALILLLGLVLLLIPTGNRKESGQTTLSGEMEADFSLEAYTKELEALLSEVSGAGEVHLLLSLDTDGERAYLTDQSESRGGDSLQSQRDTVLAHRDGNQIPVVQTETYPRFRGAVVVCQGADGAAVTLRMKEAVSCLTGLGMDRITVLKMR